MKNIKERIWQWGDEKNPPPKLGLPNDNDGKTYQSVAELLHDEEIEARDRLKEIVK